MNSQVNSGAIRSVVTGAVVLGVFATTLVGVGAAHADEDDPEGRPCAFNQASYPAGSVLHFNGATFECVDGGWQQTAGWDRPRKPGHGDSGDAPTKPGTVHPSVFSSNLSDNAVADNATASYADEAAAQAANQPPPTITKNSYTQSATRFR